MKTLSVVAMIAFFVAGATGQNSTSTTQTDCSLHGNTADCTSTTQTQTYPPPQPRQSTQAYQNGYITGQAIGNSMAKSIAVHRANNWVKKYCKKHGSGSSWWYYNPTIGRFEGTCD
jgi:hypothetical protein